MYKEWSEERRKLSTLRAEARVRERDTAKDQSYYNKILEMEEWCVIYL